VSITIPKDAAGGGYYGAVRFAPEERDGAQNVTLSASVGSLILVRVPGDVKENLELQSFDVRHGDNAASGSALFTTNKDLYAVARFSNKGNVHTQPFGKIVVKKSGKIIQTLEINKDEPKANVLPDSTRKFSVKLDKLGSFGKYTVDGNFGYGDNGQLITGSTSIFIIPLFLIIAGLVFLILILALLFGLPRAVKRYNQSVIKKASRR